MLEPLKTWKDEYEKLPDLAPSFIIGITNLTNYVDARVTGKMTLDGIFGSPEPVYKWQKQLFLTSLLSLSPAPDPIGKIRLASAWLTATTSSIMTVAPGVATTNPPTPATQFSAVASTIVDPLSLTKAHANLLKGLLKAKSSSKKRDSELPPLFLAAFKSLTFTVSGSNSVTPTVSPLAAPSLPVK